MPPPIASVSFSSVMNHSRRAKPQGDTLYLLMTWDLQAEPTEARPVSLPVAARPVSGDSSLSVSNYCPAAARMRDGCPHHNSPHRPHISRVAFPVCGAGLALYRPVPELWDRTLLARSPDNPATDGKYSSGSRPRTQQVRLAWPICSLKPCWITAHRLRIAFCCGLRGPIPVGLPGVRDKSRRCGVCQAGQSASRRHAVEGWKSKGTGDITRPHRQSVRKSER